MDITQRSLEPELMDIETRSDEETFEAYRFLTRVNRYLFASRVIFHHLKQWSKQWPKDKTIRILDIASGACDIPKEIIRWAKKKNFKVELIALDLSQQALSFGQQTYKEYPEIKFIQANCFQIPIKKVDYVISSAFFHHLDNQSIIQALKHFNTIAQKGLIISDLQRSKRAYCWIRLFSLLTKNELVRYDGPLSVLKALKLEEAKDLVTQSSLDYLHVRTHFGHRLSLAGVKKE